MTRIANGQPAGSRPGRPYRIVYVANSMVAFTSASILQVMKMCAAFAGGGARVELVVPFKLRDWLRLQGRRQELWDWYAVPPNFRIRFLPHPHLGSRFRYRGYGITAALLATARRADLVYTRNLWVAYWCARWGRPVVFESHDLNEERARPAFAPFLRELGQNPAARGVVAISDQLRRDYVDAGAPDEKVFTLHDAVDLDRFRDPLTKREARDRLNLPRESRIVCHLGSLYDGRGIEHVLACARNGPEALYVFVGGRPEEIQHYADQAHDLANVRFVGLVPNSMIQFYLYASDVLVMPYMRRVPTSRYMSPLKLFEYMAAERAIVATDFPTIREICEPDKHLILVPPDDAKALLAGIRRVLADPEMAGRMAGEARRAVESHTWENRATAIVSRFGGDLARPS